MSADLAAAKKKNDDLDVPVAKVGEAPASTGNATAGAPKRLTRKPYSVKRTHDIIMEGASSCVCVWVTGLFEAGGLAWSVIDLIESSINRLINGTPTLAT